MFREVNDRLRELSETFALDGATIDAVCECGRSDCVDRIEMRVETYDRVRHDSGSFVMKPDHAAAQAKVVERRDAYVVVKNDS